MISVLVATKNKPGALIQLIRSLLVQRYPFELLVADQSDVPQNTIYQQFQKYSNVRFFSLRTSGKSVALNTIIPYAKSDILAFTDDDCVVHKNWLSEIRAVFTHNPTVDFVLGSTLPYQPYRHTSMTCPRATAKQHQLNITQPNFRFGSVGSGCNMAIRHTSFAKVGLFKPWLGPGSIGKNYEDAELVYRILLSARHGLYTPHVRVYHNKWLTPKETRITNLSYTRGEMACYGYFSCQGYAFAKRLTKKTVRSSFYRLKTSLSLLIHFNWSRKTFGGLYWSLLMLWHQTIGFAIGWYFSIITRFHNTP